MAFVLNATCVLSEKGKLCRDDVMAGGVVAFARHVAWSAAGEWRGVMMMMMMHDETNCT